MKKYILTVIAAAMLCGLCSCGDKVTTESAGEKTTEASTEAAITTEAPAETETSADTEAVTSAAAVTTAVQPASAPEGADLGVFHNNGSGAIVFDAPAGDQSEATLIAAAQALYESAHRTSLAYSIGCPYTYDTDTYIEGSYGWQYYLVTESGVNSVADVKADYHKVFSEKYPDDIDLTYIDGDGRVYCLCGQRGTNISYVRSEVISLDGKSDDELFFTVRDYYDGSEWGEGESTEDRTFSAVIDPDGTWRAGAFTLPN
ncbi:MAG: hypothetical protein Q4A05_11570 [Ruminococcus sp.]|nr:hypothetical protein [Ruminococcus sp.]